MSDKGEPTNQFIVTSNYQSGGITAGQVHIGSPRRTFSDYERQQLRNNLPPDAKVEVRFLMGYEEAYAHALEVHRFLQSDGYAVRALPLSALMMTPFPGWARLNNDLEGGYYIDIGHARPAT